MSLMPEISVFFRTQAASIIERSERGNVLIIIRDEGYATIGTRKYISLSQFLTDASLYTTANATAIKDALHYNPFALYVIAIDDEDALSVGLALVEGVMKTGWITVAGITSDDSTALAAWILAKETAKKSYKGVVYTKAADCKHVVNFVNTAVDFADGRTAAASTFTPSLAAILATCNIQRGATNFACTNLKSVTEPANVGTAVDAGGLVLINDEDGVVRIAAGVNSLTTLAAGETEDLKSIEVIEGMDMIYEDIVYAFRNDWQGSHKNSRGEQYAFISAVNSYFDSLVVEGLLNDAVENTCDIDVVAQRAAWQAAGTDTSGWSDDDVKDHPFRKKMFLTGTISMLQSIESLIFGITLN